MSSSVRRSTIMYDREHTHKYNSEFIHVWMQVWMQDAYEYRSKRTVLDAS